MIQNIRGLFNGLPISEEAEENKIKQLNPKTHLKID
jgi:hypothetical protein